MINEIIYYYNLYPNKILIEKNNYKFYLNGCYYYFLSCKDVDKIKSSYEMSIYLKKYNIYCHSFILNKYGEIYSVIDNNNFVLLRSSNFFNNVVDVTYLFYYYNSFYLFNSDDNFSLKMRNSFINRVDYFEYEIENFKLKFPIIYSSSRYFIGLAENSIQLLYNFNVPLNLSINHVKISGLESFFEFYNPLNLIVDVRFRDFSEFLKYNFFYKDISFEQIKKYILQFIKSSGESIVFLSRLMYPSYFFELCDSIFYDSISEFKIYLILNKINNFENFIKNVYFYLSLYYSLPNVDWLVY